MITAEQIRETLTYDPLSGSLRWLVTRGAARYGAVAGTLRPDGYRQIKIDGRTYKAHRLAWLHAHGVWPDDEIDHVNGDRADNRIANLRKATWIENQWNARRRVDNTSGFKGVSWHKENTRWRADIRVNGKAMGLGYHDTPEEAHAAYVAAARE